MLIKNSIWFIIIAPLMCSLRGQSIPTAVPSTLCVHTNESLFLKGSGFAPGEAVSGYITSSSLPFPYAPSWSFYADTNGEFNVNITCRTNIQPSQPTAVQEYYFSTWNGDFDYTFHVWYQTENNTSNQWHSVIAGFSKQLSNQYPDQQTWFVTINANVAPNNNYQVQAATDILGPWRFVGHSTLAEDTNSVFVSGFNVPLAPQMFFRIGDPYGPCPCNF